MTESAKGSIVAKRLKGLKEGVGSVFGGSMFEGPMKLPQEVIDELGEDHTDVEQASINEQAISSYDSYQELYDNYSDGPLKNYARECESKGVDYKTFKDSVYRETVRVLVAAATNMVHGITK